MTHSQGPWEATGWNNLTVNTAAGNTIVAIAGGDGNNMGVPKEEMQANARLIAASPEMLEALELMLGTFEYPSNTSNPAVVAAKAAVSKAKGE